MSLSSTVFDRLKKFFRVEMQIPAATLTEKNALGDKPLAFDDEFIDSDLRHRINRWFEDMVDPFPGGEWDGTSTLGEIAKDIVDATEIADLDAYRDHVTTEINVALDREIGAGGTSVPVADRPLVRDHLNGALVHVLIRDVALTDLAGVRSDIVDAVLAKMVS
jgi:hypothetical protein